MSKLLVLYAALQCSPTKLRNDSSLSWIEEDAVVLKYNKNRCSELYKNSPCLKLFIKKGKLNYWIICGKAKGGHYDGF